MGMKIQWTKRGLRCLERYIDFIESNQSSYVAQFVELIYRRLDQLQKYPKIGMPSQQKKTVRSVRVDKHCRMYYRLNGRRIIIVYFFDNRQHPDKNKYA